MRGVIRWTGPIGEKVTALLVLAAVCLALLAIILVYAGAYESVSNPQVPQGTSQVCAFVPDNSGQVPPEGTTPAGNVTGGK